MISLSMTGRLVADDQPVCFSDWWLNISCLWLVGCWLMISLSMIGWLMADDCLSMFWW
jgi:hypothetical protein